MSEIIKLCIGLYVLSQKAETQEDVDKVISTLRKWGLKVNVKP